MAKTSPTQRSLAYLRKQGYLACVVEKWIPRANIRKDAFDCIDVLAIRPGEVLGVQATSRDHVSHRITKIRELDHFEQLQACPIRIVVHGWGKMASGKWELREEVVA